MLSNAYNWRHMRYIFMKFPSLSLHQLMAFDFWKYSNHVRHIHLKISFFSLFFLLILSSCCCCCLSLNVLMYQRNNPSSWCWIQIYIAGKRNECGEWKDCGEWKGRHQSQRSEIKFNEKWKAKEIEWNFFLFFFCIYFLMCYFCGSSFHLFARPFNANNIV